MTIKTGFLWILKNTLNRVTLRAARHGAGPFSLVRHVGRKTGTVYETPLMLAATPSGFVAELTYGTEVSWYRNVVAAGHCVIVFKGTEHQITAIEPCTTRDGMDAFGYPRAFVLKLLRRHDFRLLRERPVTGAVTPPLL